MELLGGILVISPLSGSGVIADAFKQFNLSDKTGRNLTCLIKKEAFEEKYTLATLRVEKYINIGYRLDFFIAGPEPIDAVYNESTGTYESEAKIYSPDVGLGGTKNLAYIYNPDNDYVIPLGEGSSKPGTRKQVVIDLLAIQNEFDSDSNGYYTEDLNKLKKVTGKTLDEWGPIVESGEYDIVLKENESKSSSNSLAFRVRYFPENEEIVAFFDLMELDKGIWNFYINGASGRIFLAEFIPARYFTQSNYDMLQKHNTDIKALEARIAALEDKIEQ